MRRLVDEAGLAGAIEVDSVATSAEELGNPPDRRAIAEADRHGLDLRDLRARRVTAGDWRWADLLLVVDDLVERALLRTAPDAAARAKVVRITDFGPDAGVLDEVPDPWYGGAEGFAEVYAVLERACRGLLDALVDRAGADRG